MLIKVIVIPLIVIGLFLFIPYVRFYQLIGEKNLPVPFSENRFILLNPRSGNVNVNYIALGDSLSAGIGSTSEKDTLIYQYATKLLKNSGSVRVVNLARPGATTDDLINNQLSQASLESPSEITLFIGINDIHQKTTVKKFEQNFLFIINELLKSTNAKITVFNIPYLGSSKSVFFPYNYLLDYQTKKFNQVIKSLSENNERIKIIDLYNASYQEFKNNDKDFYAEDLFHPSNKGYLFWGQIINAD